MTTNDILTLVAVGLFIVIAILGFIYWYMARKEKEGKGSKNKGNTKEINNKKRRK